MICFLVLTVGVSVSIFNRLQKALISSDFIFLTQCLGLATLYHLPRQMDRDQDNLALIKKIRCDIQ